MTWLSRLKKISMPPETDATKPTKPVYEGREGGFVGFVASISAPAQKTASVPADTEPWDAADWQACYQERAAAAEYDGAIPRPQAEAQAYHSCVSEWMRQSFQTSEPGSCAQCGRGDLTYGPVMPYGDAIHGHTWLHGECWAAWYAKRRQAAIAALAGFDIGERVIWGD